jgi:hypothetical protein
MPHSSMSVPVSIFCCMTCLTILHY